MAQQKIFYLSIAPCDKCTTILDCTIQYFDMMSCNILHWAVLYSTVMYGRDYLIHTADDVRVHCYNIQTCCIQSEDSLWPAACLCRYLAFVSGRNRYLKIRRRYLTNTGLYVVGPSALSLFLLSTTQGRQTHQGKVTWGKDVLYSWGDS